MTDGFAPSASRLAAINCTACGSPLPALAGHRAKALVCSYCGAVMDRHDEYRLLTRYRDMDRPEGPFQIGMTGEIMGVEQTIVGIVGVSATIEGGHYGWTNYQLYSPTHGYSWMTWSDGHVTHSRKTRDMPETGGNFAYRAPLAAAGRTFQMFEQYVARISYLEGELTWVPALGDQTQVIEAIDPPYGYSVVIGGSETEFEFGTYLDRPATLAAFGVEDSFPRAYTVHAIQPFLPGSFHTALSRAGKVFAPVALVLGLAFLAIGTGQKITETVIPDTDKGGSLVFPLDRPNRLAELRLTTNVINSWSWYDMELVHEESDETVAEFDGGIEYYEGHDSDGRWTEGSQTATFRFKPPAAGAYRLTITTGDPQSARLPVRVEVRENVMLSRYLFGLALFFALCWLSLWFRNRAFEAKRWGDDDEDD